MLIQKNDSTKIISFGFPQLSMIDPDNTCKSSGLLFYSDLTLDGADNSSYLDFDQPIVKSYVVDVTDSTTAQSIFVIDTSLTQDQIKNAERITVTLTDATGKALIVPNINIKIFTNLWSATDQSSAPFMYFTTNTMTFSHVKRQLYSLYIVNKSNATIKAIVQIQKHNEDGSNFNAVIYK